MTAISPAHAGKPDFRHIDKWFATTIRLRTEGTDHLLAAARAAGVSHVVAQGFASWNGIREGGWVKTEDDPLDPGTGTVMESGSAAMRYLEDAVLRAGGAVLRYGGFYGPGATDDQVELVRKRQFPLVGSAAGYLSWVHLDDAASATVLALEQRRPGCSTSSTTNQPRLASGCRIWPRAQGLSGRCGSPNRWPGGWPGTWR
jgi:nucleoside-diphosphate-sugar epimerase